MSEFENTYLNTQYGQLVIQFGLLAATFFFYRKLVGNDTRREERAVEHAIKHWCKSVFKQVDSPGALQRAGAKVRERFPERMDLILAAYDELSAEDPSRDRPILDKFLDSMNDIERDKWPGTKEAKEKIISTYK